MATFYADILIYLKENMQKRERNKFSKDINSITGVRSVVNSAKNPKVYIVHYDNMETSSRDILNKTIQNGMKASIIGL